MRDGLSLEARLRRAEAEARQMEQVLDEIVRLYGLDPSPEKDEADPSRFAA